MRCWAPPQGPSPPARSRCRRVKGLRPIDLLVGFAPGGGTDIISRLLQPTLQADLGQTLFMTTVSASAVVPPHMNPPPFDLFRDQTPIVLAATVPLVVVVPLSSRARDLRGLVEHARTNPGKLNYSPPASPRSSTWRRSCSPRTPAPG